MAENNDENHVIIVNCNKAVEEQNYHGTHEFMHLFCDENDGTKIFSCFDAVKPNQNPYIEWFANEGVAEFLVGYKTFIPLFSEWCNVFTYNLIIMTYGD